LLNKILNSNNTHTIKNVGTKLLIKAHAFSYIAEKIARTIAPSNIHTNDSSLFIDQLDSVVTTMRITDKNAPPIKPIIDEQNFLM